MHVGKHSCNKIAAILFLTSTLLSTYFLKLLEFTNILALSGGLFTSTITTGIWLEVSYRYLIEQATAPLDKLIEKL